MKGIVVGHRAVKGALVVGQDKFQTAMILEPEPDLSKEATRNFIDQVWPMIEQANLETVAHGRVVRELVAVADPAMPFLHAGKGTVQLTATVRLYKDIIDSLYKGAESATEDDSTLDFSGEQALTESLLGFIRGKLYIEINDTTEFFAAEMDSLQVITLAHAVRSALAGSRRNTLSGNVSARVICRHSTPRELARYLLSNLDDQDRDDVDEDKQEVVGMQKLLTKYINNWPELRSDKSDHLDHGQPIILTGSTGSLGAYIFHRLCQPPSISKFIGLNCDEDGGLSRQLSVGEFRGLTFDLSKVEFIHTDLFLPRLNIEKEKYTALLTSADCIVHNAWPVNFSMSIASSHVFGE